MGPDNRATDVTLPAICSQHQPWPPVSPPLRPTASPSPGMGSQGQSRAGEGGWPVMADGDRETVRG